MSGANADRRDTATSIDELRVDRGGPADPAAAPSRDEADWAQADARLRCAQVSADPESWREELNRRMERLERRLSETRKPAE